MAICSRLVGGTAVACLLVGCSWVVYTNIISANVYPTLGTAGYDEPVVKLPKLASRSVDQAVKDAFAALPELALTIEKPATVAASLLFSERFAAAEPQSVASNAVSAAPLLAAPKLAEAPKPLAGPRLAEAPKKEAAPTRVAMAAPPPALPGPRATEAPAKPQGSSLRDMAQRAKAAVMSIASNERSSIVEKLWGKESSSRSSLLAYASADASVTGSLPREQDPTSGGQAPYDRDTAVYDITAHTVYLPDGSKLDAHSGLGSNLDDPRSERVRMRGVTPPHIYTLKPREALFHGVAALRLTPVGGEDAIHGRDGLLAHTFMLGPNGDSNGCVSFRDYSAFLSAYHNQGIRKLAVVARVQ